MNDACNLTDEQSSRSSHGTSRSLIARVRADDASAWNHLVTLYAPLVAHWCRRWRLADADTADVFQEVFQTVATRVGAFRNDREHDTFRGWLRTITMSKVHDHFRRQQREPRAIGGSEAWERFSRYPAPAGSSYDSSGTRSGSQSPGVTSGITTSPADPRQPGDESPLAYEPTGTDEASVERRLFRRGLRAIEAEFEPRTWQAFWRTAVDGRAASDVGAELAMSPGAVRVAKSRVLQRLRAELGDIAD